MFPPWPVAQVETEKRRLEVIVRLAHTPGYELSAMLLREHCRAVGVPTNTDQMSGCLAWLAEQMLVLLKGSEDSPVARLTPLGRETALGHRRHPGVMQPDP
ncbi:VpaChn25_0724 family phage protein [Litorisediminicola beolgyonensis]|uniref:Uncharacterized protein n=1 Tax=Litorisediminicola beolgyonensis TaxID=1173614 RepID=A0ABW3ZID9_9RHOB